MKSLKYILMIIIGILALSLISCSSSSSNGSSDSGGLSVALSDAPASEYEAVYVTISEIQVHKADDAEGEWLTVLTPNATYNLLELINGNTASLGVADLATGTYTQMRLILAEAPDSTTNILGNLHPYANYLVTKAHEAIELKVPSGLQTGIKLVHNFDVESGRTVGLILDFDAGRSVVKAGKSGNWLLKPTIKVIDTLNNATLTGTVTDGSQNAVAGVTVSAQIYNASAATEAEKVTTVVSTITDANGNYLMYLPPGTYNLVVVADGFGTSATSLTTEYDTAYTEDFTLTAATMEIITVELTLPAGTSDEAAAIEFRQTLTIDTTEQQITVDAVNYAETGSYTVSLPAGAYNVIATYNGTTITADAVSTGSSVTVDFSTQ